MSIESFDGPLTAGAISDWLSRCEEDFDAYDDANPNRSLTNKQKIHRAMASVSRTHEDSKRISTWYTRHRVILDNDDWDTFRDKVKEHSLGKGWRIKVLHEFYTYHQGSASLADYIDKFEELGYAVERSCQLKKVDAMAYKCHLLFNSRPELVQKFMHENKNDEIFVGYGINHIKTILRDLDDEVPVSTPTPTPAPAPAPATAAPQIDIPPTAAIVGSYITSGLLGTTVKTAGTDTMFSSLQDMPTSSTSLGHLQIITCYANNNSTRPQIQQISVYFTGGPSTHLPASPHDKNTYGSISFAKGEYLTTVTVTRDEAFSAITSIEFKTPLATKLSMGISKGNKTTFTAPTNWRIVGFHGTAGSHMIEGTVIHYPITKLGVIYAPILP
ncbi:hypothetical protein ONZ43_g4148 [Nemania bipapillata]|uniref:Uncharacterized protein n=1 Tax=Nemania bipapillata TaxID=110536 RepID=A0ACC2IR49_9PEZI|nr:hypothetical protein ONZ43_g4148 [Nemania bipapillata]